jgi:hypothetical protein
MFLPFYSLVPKHKLHLDVILILPNTPPIAAQRSELAPKPSPAGKVSAKQTDEESRKVAEGIVAQSSIIPNSMILFKICNNKLIGYII